MPNIKEFPLEEQPRQRLLHNDPSSLSAAELLALVLGQGTKDKNVLELARDILSQDSLHVLSRKSLRSLRRRRGIGLAKAAKLVACFELGRRVNGSFSTNPLLNSPERVYRLLNHMNTLKKEHLVALHLDTRKRLIRQKTVFIGTLDASIIHPREIFKSAIDNSAASLIIVHNHPSGDPSPSWEDISITKQMVSAGNILGIPLLDHIIIGSSRFTSLRDREGIFQDSI